MGDGSENAAVRRDILAPAPNPDDRLDTLASLRGVLSVFAPGEKPVTVEIHYVPDKMILGPGPFDAYLKHLDAEDWDSLEACGHAILDDVNNELVPRWVQVRLTASTEHYGGRGLTGCLEHRVMLEDRQPRWNNPQLLERLRQR